MKIVRINQLEETPREVHGEGFVSFRALLEKDGMGFSLHKTVIPNSGGKKHHWHYTKHLEACYCIKGKGIITDLSNGREHLITPDTIYVLDNHDDHMFEALEDCVLISVFNPPVKGNEIHKKDGSYE
jgi:L-ectoine synthase